MACCTLVLGRGSSRRLDYIKCGVEFFLASDGGKQTAKPAIHKYKTRGNEESSISMAEKLSSAAVVGCTGLVVSECCIPVNDFSLTFGGI